MPIKLMARGLARIGYVKIGDKSPETRTTSSGNTMQDPIKLDHFEITTLERDPKTDRLVRDQGLMDRLGEKPRLLKVRLPFNDPELVFQSRLSYYKNHTLYCWGDGDTAYRLSEPERGSQAIFGPSRPWSPCGEGCPDFQARRCRPLGILKVILDEQQTVGGCYEFRTSSWNSIRNIEAGLEAISAITGGIIAWIPLHLKLVSQQVQPRTGGAAQRAWIAQLTFDGSPEHLLREVNQLLSTRTPLLQEIRRKELALQAALQALPPGATIEDPEESRDIAREFFPDAPIDVPAEDVATPESPAPTVSEAPSAPERPADVGAPPPPLEPSPVTEPPPAPAVAEPSPPPSSSSAAAGAAGGSSSPAERAPTAVAAPSGQELLTRPLEGLSEARLRWVIQQLLKALVPGEAVPDKKARAAALQGAFDGLGWTKITQLSLQMLRAGTRRLQLYGQIQAELARLSPGDDSEREDYLREAFGGMRWAEVLTRPTEGLEAGLAILARMVREVPPAATDEAVDDLPPDEAPEREGPPETPELDAEGCVVWGDVETLKLWAAMCRQTALLEQHLQQHAGYPEAPKLSPVDYVRYRGEIDWAARTAATVTGHDDLPRQGDDVPW